MSDQGDAGTWRPATSQNDQHEPDETTGPLPRVSGDETGEQGFPSVKGSSASGPSPSWAAEDDDDAPTGGFPAVSSADEEPPAPPSSYSSFSSSSRSPFEPVERPASPREPAGEDEDPGANGPTPQFGTEVHDPRPAEKYGSFENPSSSSSNGSSSFGDFSYGSSAGDDSSSSSSSSYGGSSWSSFGSTGYDDKPADTPSSPYGRESFSAEPGTGTPGTGTPGTGTPGTGTPGAGAPPEGASTGTGAFSLPRAERRPTAEDEAAEAEFFASDDHPPMWDKVVAPSGPPPKPGKPSSGNLRLPDWMRDENAAAPAGGGGEAGGSITSYEDEGRSRRGLFIGLGILVAGLVAVAGVYVLKGNGDSEASKTASPTKPSPSHHASQPAQANAPRKALPRFKGVHTKARGRVSDPRSGLSYARFAGPWAVPPKKSPMNELGFSVSQFAVTEKAGGQPKHWARLMSAELAGAAKDAYSGPGSEQAATAQVAEMYEARMFGFRHKKRVLANQPLTVDGHKGWLVSDYLTYRRPGTRATGDIVAVALVDTGKKTPGIVFMSVPNTSRKLWPDVNFMVRSLKVL